MFDVSAVFRGHSRLSFSSSGISHPGHLETIRRRTSALYKTNKALKPKSHHLDDDDADRQIRMIDSSPAGVSLWETPRR